MITEIPVLRVFPPKKISGKIHIDLLKKFAALNIWTREPAKRHEAGMISLLA